MLSKEVALYTRDEKGILIPVEVQCVVDESDKQQAEYKGKTVKVIPMTRGEIRKMFADFGTDAVKEANKDLDGEIILKYCKDPAFTEVEIPFLKPVMATVLVNTIFQQSGIEPRLPKKEQ